MANRACFSKLRVFLKGMLPVLWLSLGACAGGQPSTREAVDMPRPVKVGGGMAVLALNYSPWYIHAFSIVGPSGNGIRGGGPNVMPIQKNGRPSGGGAGVCCMIYPLEWQPDLKLTVRWLLEKRRADGKKWGYWYKAENVQIAEYDGANANEAWGIFLPGDRVRVMITDGNRNGGNNPNNCPADNDPYIAQGVIDEEWNRRYPPAHD